MLVLTWLIIGLISGLVSGSLFQSKNSTTYLTLIVFSICGAMIGGILFTLFNIDQPGSPSIFHTAVSIAGALSVMFIYKSIHHPY